MDARTDIIQAANWLLARNKECTYTERVGTAYGERFYNVRKPFSLPFFGDCSSTVTDLFNWADAPDPNLFNYSGYGDTQSMIANPKAHQISAEIVVPGDCVFFGEPPVHVALVMEKGANPLCFSMGMEGDPRLYRVSEMTFLGVPRYWRFPTRKVGPVRRAINDLGTRLERV